VSSIRGGIGARFVRIRPPYDVRSGLGFGFVFRGSSGEGSKTWRVALLLCGAFWLE